MASIVTLKCGQRVIAEINEIFNEIPIPENELVDGGPTTQRKGVGLQLRDPFLLEHHENPQAEDPEERNRVKFIRWNPFTLDRTFKVPYEAVVCVSSPDPNLDSAFTEKQAMFDSYDVVEEVPGDTDDTATETAE